MGDQLARVPSFLESPGHPDDDLRRAAQVRLIIMDKRNSQGTFNRFHTPTGPSCRIRSCEMLIRMSPVETMACESCSRASLSNPSVLYHHCAGYPRQEPPGTHNPLRVVSPEATGLKALRDVLTNSRVPSPPHSVYTEIRPACQGRAAAGCGWEMAAHGAFFFPSGRTPHSQGIAGPWWCPSAALASFAMKGFIRTLPPKYSHTHDVHKQAG
jgi:hypothetical protein